jgi:hypothetical protein
MRIVILGAGGVGRYFGGRLAAAGSDVTFVAGGAQLVALQRDGLKICQSASKIDQVNIARWFTLEYELLTAAPSDCPAFSRNDKRSKSKNPGEAKGKKTT